MSRFTTLCLVCLLIGCAGSDGPKSEQVANISFAMSNCKINSGDVYDGGPGPDGIPAILNPIFKPLSEFTDDDLSIDETLVLVVRFGDEMRAFPDRVLWLHEIINDELDGQPLVISYCPLTGSGIAMKKESGENFLVSGLLYQTNLIMYDQSTRSLWPQMELEASCGERLNEAMRLIPIQEMKGTFLKKLYPEIEVVYDSTRSSFNYVTYPYGAYDLENNNTLLFPVSNVDDTLPIKSLVLTVFANGQPKGYPHLNFGGDGIINDRLAEVPYVVFHLEEPRFANAYSRVVNGQELNMELLTDADDPVGYYLKDEETGTRWDLRGRGVDGPLAGERLTQMLNFNVMWFSYKLSFPQAPTFQPSGKVGSRLFE